MLVKDAMTRDPACCTPATALHEVARLMAEHDCGAIPVVRDGGERKPVGIITDRDIVVRALADGRDPYGTTVGDCMSNSCVTIAPDATIEDCCKVMEAYQVRRVVVVDEGGRALGVVSQADVATAASDEDVAAVVREISQPGFGQAGAVPTAAQLHH
jgi:CBS domain-containing protein